MLSVIIGGKITYVPSSGMSFNNNKMTPTFQADLSPFCRQIAQPLMSIIEPVKPLTHWGWVTHLCVSRLTITGSNNGLLPGQCQAIIWTNAVILLIGLLGTNFSENFIEILTFSSTKMRLKVSSAKWRPFCLGLNELTHLCLAIYCYQVSTINW